MEMFVENIVSKSQLSIMYSQLAILPPCLPSLTATSNIFKILITTLYYVRSLKWYYLVYATIAWHLSAIFWKYWWKAPVCTTEQEDFEKDAYYRYSPRFAL